MPVHKRRTAVGTPSALQGAFATAPASSQSPDPKPGKDRRRWWPWVGVGAIALGSVIGIDAGRRYLIRQLPDAQEVYTFLRPGTLTILSADGYVLQKIGPATREKLRLQQIPPLLQKAFLAAEDRRFYQHDGIDYWGVIRATHRNLLSRGVVEGASTITQQLARIVFLNQEKTFGRKFQEALMAQKLEDQLSKDQILENYLNLVYLGSGAYGVADAAWVYFSKPVKDLSLGEMATIAGLPPAPSLYSPQVNPQFAKERRNLVLQRMTEAGFISAAQAIAAEQDPLRLKSGSPKYFESLAPYFTSYVRQELPKFVSPEALEYGGLTLRTTLYYSWQKVADEVIQASLGGAVSEGALTAIDPQTGAIRAMVGGADFSTSQFNRAVQAQRQPGSTFKMFVYAAAIASGISPDKTYVDEPIRIGSYAPKNYGNRYRGSMSMTQALTNSVNIVAIKILRDVGFHPVIDLARRMGIRSRLEPFYSLALGSLEVNLLELTGAYGALANQGRYVPPHPIASISDYRGKEIYTDKALQSVQALDPGNTALITQMLTHVVNEGTGAPAALGDRPVAGKTGTSEKARDLWFVGFIPQLATGVWLGNDENLPTGGSSSEAAYVWYRFMRAATQTIPVADFLPPPAKQKVTIKAVPIRDRMRVSAPPPDDSESYGGSYSGGNNYYGGSSDSGASSESGDSDYSESYSEPAYQEPAYQEPAPTPAPEAAPEPSAPSPDVSAPVEPVAPAATGSP
jgi:penicillin-binding protein 1A